MERYYARFMARDGQIRRWSVFDESYSGAATELTLSSEGIIIQEDKTEGGFVPIRSWSGYAYVIDRGNISGLIATDAHSLPMTIQIEGGAVEWSGYIGTEVRTQTYPSNGNVIEIPIKGKLATAQGYNISEQMGMTTLANLLREALLLSGYQDSDFLQWPERYCIPNLNRGLSVLAASVSRALFVTGKSERTQVSIGDSYDTPITDSAEFVIAEIAKMFGYTFYERGNEVTAIAHFETRYQRIRIGDLPSLSSTTDYQTYPQETVSAQDFPQMITPNQSTSLIQGKHSVSVVVELQKMSGNLIDFNVEDFPFVNSYKRPLDYSNPKEGYKFLFTQVFECNNHKDIRTYAYYRQSTGSNEDYKVGWYEENSISGAGWYYGYKQGAEKKPGCFPARISISEENPYFDPEYKPGGSLNKWLVGRDFHDGFIFNPALYENGDNGFISHRYPIIKIRKKETGIYSKGTFAINFNVGAFPVCSKTQNSPDPVTPFCNFSVTLRVGEYSYKMLTHSDGSVPQYGWVKNDTPTQLPIYTNIDVENAFPTSMSVKDSRGADRIWRRVMPNVSGMTFPIWDANGNEIVVTGDIEMTLYADSNDAITGDNKKKKPRLLFISNLKLEFIPDDQYSDGYVPRLNKKERVLHKLTTKGFPEGEEKVSLKFGSMSADNSSSMSAMMIGGIGIGNIAEISSHAQKAPEEFLLGNLLQYYDRVVERRDLTSEQLSQPDVRSIIKMGGRRWRQVAIAENYGEGTRTITLEDA